MTAPRRPATAKQQLLAHMQERHAPASRRRSLSRLTFRELQVEHGRDHHRYEPAVGHLHWDGTDEDRNRGASHRPAGWRTGGDVRERV